MIKQYDLSQIGIDKILNREFEYCDQYEDAVAAIIENVRKNGDAALFDYCRQFDKVELSALEVTKEEFDAAERSVDPAFLQTLTLAKDNITAFHKNQRRQNFILNDKEGVVLGQKITPMARVGLYVPGGTATYPSSVLMNAIPAKLAGVKELILVTPPRKDGTVADVILAAARLAGVDRVFKVGGAQAVAALAYGTESIPRVQKIVGPGNIFVATAKRRVFGLVDIDMIAGPSEILVVADESANPRHVAADMLSQAEHDVMATAVLITDCKELCSAVAQEIETQLALLPRRDICRKSIDDNGKIILASSLKEAIDTANIIAPEHLELCVKDPFAALNQVKNAGSIFLGHNAPEALGDYLAGPNHILPTGGTAAFSSPLSVDDFIKKSSFIYYTKDALKGVYQDVVRFAEFEGLHAHGNSAAIRFEDEK